MIPKKVKSVAEQENYESRKLWQNVTSSLKRLDFAIASQQIIQLRKSCAQQPIGGSKSDKGERVAKFFAKKEEGKSYKLIASVFDKEKSNRRSVY